MLGCCIGSQPSLPVLSCAIKGDLSTPSHFTALPETLQDVPPSSSSRSFGAPWLWTRTLACLVEWKDSGVLWHVAVHITIFSSGPFIYQSCLHSIGATVASPMQVLLWPSRKDKWSIVVCILENGILPRVGLFGRRFWEGFCPRLSGGRIATLLKGSISHSDTLSCLSLAADSSHSTCHTESIFQELTLNNLEVHLN